MCEPGSLTLEPRRTASGKGGEAMTNQEAIQRLEEMPEDKFQLFFGGLPWRVQLLVKGGLVDWRECLANWYIREGGRK